MLDRDHLPKNHVGWTLWLYWLFAVAVIVLTIVGFIIASP